LETVPPQADQELVGCNAHLGEVGEEAKRALETCVVGLRLIGAKASLGESADVADLVARLQ
jgi:hypothetical protein